MLEISKTVYVTRDIERALGIISVPYCYIISNYTNYGKLLAEKHDNILLIKANKLLDTWELLNNTQTQDWIKTQQPNILVFKNTSQIEKICQQNSWNLLNPSSKLSNEVEQKISQVQWAGVLKKYFPDYQIKQCQEIEWQNEPMIVQFNHSHTGSGTILIKNKKQLQDIKDKFPKRLARTARYIKGPLFTNNNVIWNNNILLGNISYQITGLKPFTNLEFATIGNDWALPHKILSTQQLDQFYKIAQEVGEKMAESGWQGAFGIDVVMDEQTKQMYLVEINARQPASVSFETKLQAYNIKHETYNKDCLTIFQAHLSSLLAVKYRGEKLIKINNGAQIIYRVNHEKQKINDDTIKMLKTNNFETVRYDNSRLNSDLLRIQSEDGIMKVHNEFNQIGQSIIDIIKK